MQNTAVNNSKIFVVDTLSVIEQYGMKNIFNNATWVYGNIRYNNLGNKLIANPIHNTINSILNKTAKCLVLDLNNTLWGGIIGEDSLVFIDDNPMERDIIQVDTLAHVPDCPKY